MKIAELEFKWTPRSPVMTGYHYKFAQKAGLIKGGERRVAQYASRQPDAGLTPSLLATSVKGVVRSAAAWLVERDAQVLQGTAADPRMYVTREYADARPESGGWREAIDGFSRKDRPDPVEQVFGGSGGTEEGSSNVLRKQGLVHFSFAQGPRTDSDAVFGDKQESGRQTFAWQEADEGTQPNPLEVEQLWVRPAAALVVRLQSDPDSEEAFELGIALLGLAADLVSSGFFRFGRFTSRGYGWVELASPRGRCSTLLQMLDGESGEWQTAPSGRELARLLLLGKDPAALVRAHVEGWLRG